MDSVRWEIDATPDRAVVVHGAEVRRHDTVLDLSHVSAVPGAPLTNALLDLADVAAAVYFADRVCRRGNPLWSRHFSLRLRVRDLERWTQLHLREAVEDALNYYTGDTWSLSFTAFTQSGEKCVQEDFFPDSRFSPTRVALFSGGLDSFAGACRELIAGTERILLVSGSTAPRLRALQGRLSFELSQRFGGRVAPVVIKFGFTNRLRRADRWDETTQRTRGFVFSALGAIAAIANGVRELSIYENGIGAINLPFTSGQHGVHLTRATNPLALRKMEAVIEGLTDQPFRIRLPFLFETKGVLCTSITDAGLEHIVSYTVSCDGFPQRVQQYPQCGLCTSCLLRRLSLYAAGLAGWDPQNYRIDVLQDGWSAPFEKLFQFRAMLYQAELLKAALRSTAPWRGLVRQFPNLFEIAALEGDGSAAFTGGRFIDLYRRYCLEWEQFPVRPGGYEASLAA